MRQDNQLAEINESFKMSVNAFHIFGSVCFFSFHLKVKGERQLGEKNINIIRLCKRYPYFSMFFL